MAKSLNISMEKMSLVRDSSFGAFVSFFEKKLIYPKVKWLKPME